MIHHDTFLSKDTRAQVHKAEYPDMRPTEPVAKIGWTDEAREAAAAARKATGGKHEPKWNQFAGGSGAAPGKYSYGANTAHGQYSISPISSQGGQHKGYSLTVADTQGQMGGGLHHTVAPDGSRHPLQGHAAPF